MVLVGDIVRLTTGEVKTLSVCNTVGIGCQFTGAFPKDFFNFEVIQLKIPQAEEIIMMVSDDDYEEMRRMMRE